MKFDITIHLQNHAYYCFIKPNVKISNNDLHFNFSYLDIQFFDKSKKPEEILEELVKELLKPATYKVKNGWRTLKDGTKKQKYTTRVINLKDVVLIIAIHIKGADNEYVMPHIHFIILKDARLGKNFSLLKTHIIEVSKKFGLKPNFAEAPASNPFAYKNLAKAVKNFSWIIRKMPNEDFREYVKNKLEDRLNKLWEYTLLSNNLQYYIKTLEFIKKRLNRQKIAFEWQGHNLKNTYPLPLTEEDLKIIELINKKEFTQKAIKPYLKNAIMRDFVRYSYFKDKSKALIINSISKQTKLLQNLRPNRRVVENYLKLYEKTLDLDKQTQIKEQQKQKQQESIKEILKEDILRVAKTCKNEKELREKMQELGYKKFGFKKKQGKVIGYQFKLQNEDKKIVVKCSDSIDIKEIRAILKENWIKSKANMRIPSYIGTGYKIKTYLLPKPPVLAPKPLKITYKTQQIEKQKALMQKRRESERDYERIRELIAIAKANARTIAKNTTGEFIHTQTTKKLAIGVRYIQKAEYRTKNESEIIRRENAELRTRIKNTVREFKQSYREGIRRAIKNALKALNKTGGGGGSAPGERIKRRIRELTESIIMPIVRRIKL